MKSVSRPPVAVTVIPSTLLTVPHIPRVSCLTCCIMIATPQYCLIG